MSVTAKMTLAPPPSAGERWLQQLSDQLALQQAGGGIYHKTLPGKRRTLLGDGGRRYLLG